MLKQIDTLIGLSVVMLVVSIFITIITQIFSSLLGLRGKNLASALEAMIYKIDPDITANVKGLAKQLADRVLTHPAVSDSMLSMKKAWPMAWKRASAIRPDELLDVLKRIAVNCSTSLTGVILSPPPATNSAVTGFRLKTVVVSNSLAGIWRTEGSFFNPDLMTDCGSQTAYTWQMFKTELDKLAYGAMATTEWIRGSTVFHRKASAAP